MTDQNKELEMLRSKHTSVQKQLITTQQELDKSTASLAEVGHTSLACRLLHSARCVKHSTDDGCPFMFPMDMHTRCIFCSWPVALPGLHVWPACSQHVARTALTLAPALACPSGEGVPLPH
jgi:hypothetical protein